MLKKISFSLVFLTICLSNNWAQSKYWIANKDTLAVKQLLHQTPIVCSNWLGHCSYQLTSEDTNILKQKRIHYRSVLQFAPLTKESKNSTLGFALEARGKAWLKLGGSVLAVLVCMIIWGSVSPSSTSGSKSNENSNSYLKHWP